MTPELITSIGAAVAAIIGSIFAARSNKKATKVEDTLNHRHKSNGDILPSLGQVIMDTHDLAVRNDMKVDELVEWKEGWETGPWRNGEDINKTLKELHTGIEEAKCAGCNNLTPCKKSEKGKI